MSGFDCRAVYDTIIERQGKYASTKKRCEKLYTSSKL